MAKGPVKATLFMFTGSAFRYERYIGDVKMQTWAKSTKQAVNNIAYRVKEKMGYASGSVKLSGKLKFTDAEGEEQTVKV